MTNSTSKNDYQFIISRNFNVSPEVMWQMWTDAKILSQWFGPKDCIIENAVVDLRVGGKFHFCVKIPQTGAAMWGKWVYQQIKPPEKLVNIVYFTDHTATKILPHPGLPDWPLAVLSEITLVNKGQQTTVIVKWQAHDASDAAKRAFKESEPAMQQGWGGTFDRLEELTIKK